MAIITGGGFFSIVVDFALGGGGLEISRDFLDGIWEAVSVEDGMDSPPPQDAIKINNKEICANL